MANKHFVTLKNTKVSALPMKSNFPLKCERSMLIRYKFILTLLFICGFNFKVFKLCNRFKFISMAYSVSLVITISITTIYSCYNNTMQMWSSFEYIFSVVLLLIYNSKLSKFSSKLDKLDVYLRINNDHYSRSRIKICIIILVLWLVRFTFTLANCFDKVCYEILTLFIISQFASFALDLNRVWRFALLEIIRYRLRYLRERLEEMPECDYYLYMSERKTFRKNKMTLCVYLYRSIADISDLVSPEIHASMFLTVVCTIPKLVINFYHILLVFEGHAPTKDLGFLITHTCQLCFLLFAPCIIVELHSVEVEKIREFLIHRSIDESNPKTKEDINMFLQFTEIRTFQRKIWRCIPMNIALPLEVANVCISAIIVAINITHLYG